MRVSKDNVNVRLEIPGAVIRQQLNFGDVSGFSNISGEYFTLSAGVDTTPLFMGLEEISVSARTGVTFYRVKSQRLILMVRRRR